MLIVRLSKIAMTAALAAFAFIVTYDNLVDYGSNYEFVKHVLSMDTTFPGNKLMGRAITSPRALDRRLCRDHRGRGADIPSARHRERSRCFSRCRRRPTGFQRTKVWLVTGVTSGFLVWFFGFMVVGGEYFAMWQSKTWNGQEAAFRFYMTMLAVLIFVNAAGWRTRLIALLTGT